MHPLSSSKLHQPYVLVLYSAVHCSSSFGFEMTHYFSDPQPSLGDSAAHSGLDLPHGFEMTQYFSELAPPQGDNATHSEVDLLHQESPHRYAIGQG